MKEQRRAKKAQIDAKYATERPQKPYKDTVRENAVFENYYKQQGIVGTDEWEDFLACVREPLPAAFRVTGSKSQAEQLLHLIQNNFFSQLNTTTSKGEEDTKELATEETSTTSVSLSQTLQNTDLADVKEVGVSEASESNGSVTAASDAIPDTDGAAAANGSTAAAGDTKSSELKPPTCLKWYPDGLAWQLEYSRVSIRQNNTLKKLHSFLVSESESGNISRQEAVSMIPPLLMDIKSHHKILDMCAALGSKTAQIIEYLHADSADPMPEGFVIGNDVDNKRCYLMVHQIKRLQSPNFMIVNHDATRLPSLTYTNEKTGSTEPLLFDRVLCDVPCSGDGTLRKNPEVWRTWGPGHAINLHSVQNRVLSRGLELLAVGGRLVYSTCSFNPIENEAVIANMIKKCEGAIHLVDCSQQLPDLKRASGMKSWKVQTKNGDWFSSFEEVPENKRSWVRPSMFPTDDMESLNIHRCMRIVPHHQNTGGFFIAVLEKTSHLPWQSPKVEVSESSTESAQADQPGSTTVDKAKEPPTKKVKYAGFREDPFFYFEADNSQWPSIKEFYKFEDSFDHTQLMVRSKEGEKKRNIYVSSKSIKNVAKNNESKIKYINTGVKVLARSEHEMCKCSYRLVQDGISSVDQFVHGRRMNIEKADVIELLTQENPFFSRLTPNTQSNMLKMDMGGLVMRYLHNDSNTGTESPILMTGWRGKTSCRVYVPKFERHHILRLCGVDPDKALIDAEWAIKGKTGPEITAADVEDPPKDGVEEITAADS
ncbi:NSUN2 [Bugula neritina]|uniref:tRNA (cytosine(34)-C(5))-methyltransferase n=1 Tax=Bugula neritina TaxID=10212 RepID=A0A7J7JEW0_BUGNE|nr:NSUN2 [Bugula neritina]